MLFQFSSSAFQLRLIRLFKRTLLPPPCFWLSVTFANGAQIIRWISFRYAADSYFSVQGVERSGSSPVRFQLFFRVVVSFLFVFERKSISAPYEKTWIRYLFARRRLRAKTSSDAEFFALAHDLSVPKVFSLCASRGVLRDARVA